MAKVISATRVRDRKKLARTLSYASRLAAFLLLLAGVLNFVSCGERRKFPDEKSFDSRILQGPVQRPLEMQPFVIDYEGKKFEAFPRAYYELSGLIVTHNDITSITDAYHDASSEDLRDICVVWGSNLSSGIYKRFRYWSEPWTCFLEPKKAEDGRKFNPLELSNTHILSAKESVRDAVWSTKVGDQIHAKGVLIDYCPVGARNMLRTTSLIRNDTGNGACEVMYVDEFSIIKESSNIWHSVYAFSWYSFWLLLVLTPTLFVWGALTESAAEQMAFRLEEERAERNKERRKEERKEKGR